MKETIMDRQIKENEGLRKAAELMQEHASKGAEYEERIHQELVK